MGALSRALCLTGLWLVSASSSVYLFADTHEIQMLDASIEELQAQLQAGTLSSVALVRWYQDRIDRYDQQGPAINAIQHSNSDAISLAKALDEERQKSGPRTLLHGIPVLVKDNYETRGMPTTAGSILFKGHAPDRDATQVERLKNAGAIILAKTTMHEFAYGWTTEGSAFGATKNPYGLTRHPGGSSGGTGAGITANFAVVGMGSDTCGSIRVPSAHNNLVGLRGTQGLSSRFGIVPLSSTQDIGGPLARSVRDLAITLDATVGFDQNDPQTTASVGKIPASYYAALTTLDPSTLRLGVLVDRFGTDSEEIELGNRIKTLLGKLQAEGANVIEVADPQVYASLVETPFFVSEFDFRKDMTAYLAANPSLGFSSLKALLDDPRIVTNVASLLRPLLGPAHESELTYLRQRARRTDTQGALLTLMHEYRLDALVYPTATREAVEIGGQHTHFNCQLAANSGLPAISVPAGFGPNQMPIAIEFLAESWSEQKLLNLALTVEKLVPARTPPKSTP